MKILLVLLCLVGLSLSVSQEVIDTLTEFYDSTNGGSWTNNGGWLNGDPCVNSWYGITCDSGDVTQIDLSINNLAGPIPPNFVNSITTLTYL